MNLISADTCGNLGELKALVDVILNSLGNRVLIVHMKESEYVVKLLER